jgi:ABC-type antimicrobial peptide transport system permease subunit
MSYTVAQRTRELGIRMALGADRRQLALLMAVKALRLSLAGVGAGLLMAYVAARGLSTLFFGVGPTDLIALSGTCAVLIVAALLAAAYPTRRAVRVDPAVALRHE